MSLFQEIKHVPDLNPELKRIHCVVDFVVLKYLESLPITVEIHRQAALTGLEILKNRLDAYFEVLLKRPEYADRQRSEFFTISFDAAQMGSGTTVERNEFLGPYCDLDQRRLLMKGTRDETRPFLFWFGEAETPENRLNWPDEHSENRGLSGAYLDPPYGLSGSQAEQNDVFFQIIDEWLEGLPEASDIYAWSPDCSNYFDAGKEWWGCYFWTVHPAGSDRIVVIAASSSD